MYRYDDNNDDADDPQRDTILRRPCGRMYAQAFIITKAVLKNHRTPSDPVVPLLVDFYATR